MAGHYGLLKARRFLPLFFTQFLGALNDNLLKNSMVILITYSLAAKAGLNAQLMVTAAAGIFILPFFLFSATAGQLADKHEKSKLIRIIKLMEIGLMGMATAGFLMENVYLLLLTLFFMGVHSTFFGPLKYSILPDHLAKEELISGNAFIEAGTFLAILLGTIIGGLLVLQEGGPLLVSGLMLAMSITGYFTSRAIPFAAPAAPALKPSFNIARETWGIMRQSKEREDVFLSIIGISWFWLVGATFLAQFPAFAQVMLHSDETVVTTFLTVFSVGIAIGSLVCNRLLKGKIHGSHVPYAALGMALFIIELYFATNAYISHLSLNDTLMGIGEFMAASVHSWRILFDLTMIALCGGIYIVPLYAIMQSRTDADKRARVIAANNIYNSLFMVLSAVVSVGMLSAGFSVTQMFLLLAAFNVPVAWLIRQFVKGQQRKQREAGLL